MTDKVSINLDKRSYDILIAPNALEKLTDFFAKSNYSKVVIVTDENVANNHLSALNTILEKNSVIVKTIILKAGEQTKSFSNLENVCEKILSFSIDRKSLIIAFGGGVIGDLAGFVASILLRGIDFIQIPTTLLSMVDSSVGGKTAINSISGKNLVGSFYQPKIVICDLNFLKTLPARQILSGYAEVVKYGFIYDGEFFEYLEKNYNKIFALDEESLAKIVTRSCQIKAEIVSRDEKEQGDRALLNFGHTFGHTFETETNYSDEILHGEAVALGMVMAAKMSQNSGMIVEDDFLRIKNHITKCGFVIDLKKIRQSWNEDNLVNHLYKDKKNENHNLTFILLEKIGKACIKKSVPLDQFKKVLREFIA